MRALLLLLPMVVSEVAFGTCKWINPEGSIGSDNDSLGGCCTYSTADRLTIYINSDADIMVAITCKEGRQTGTEVVFKGVGVPPPGSGDLDRVIDPTPRDAEN